MFIVAEVFQTDCRSGTFYEESFSDVSSLSLKVPAWAKWGEARQAQLETSAFKSFSALPINTRFLKNNMTLENERYDKMYY